MNCFFCKGDMVDSTTSYVVNMKNCIIVVKNVPCMECTQCGETSFDDSVAQRLEEIVKPLRGVQTEVAIVNFAGRVA